MDYQLLATVPAGESQLVSVNGHTVSVVVPAGVNVGENFVFHYPPVVEQPVKPVQAMPMAQQMGVPQPIPQPITQPIMAQPATVMQQPATVMQQLEAAAVTTGASAVSSRSLRHARSPLICIETLLSTGLSQMAAPLIGHVTNHAPPPGAPGGGVWTEEKYCGKTTWTACIVVTLLFFPAAGCVPCCKCDSRTVYKIRGRRIGPLRSRTVKFDANGIELPPDCCAGCGE